MSDLRVRDNVIDELVWDPRVDANEIGVTVKGGVATLHGTVGAEASVALRAG
jgi:osmotically-inducible protein OsmY